MDEDWQVDLERWLAPYLEGLGNKTRRRMCPAYIAGLIGPGDRKSIQPMAARSDAISSDRLHHFIGAGLWDSAPLEATLWEQADQLVGGDEAWLIIDDAALPVMCPTSNPWRHTRCSKARSGGRSVGARGRRDV